MVDQKKQELKEVQKESKAQLSIIKSYMVSQDMTHLTLDGGYTFTNQITERLSWNEKNVAQLIDPHSDFFERYREQFTATSQKFACKPPKRPRSASTDEHP